MFSVANKYFKLIVIMLNIVMLSVFMLDIVMLSDVVHFCRHFVIFLFLKMHSPIHPNHRHQHFRVLLQGTLTEGEGSVQLTSTLR
jgi:hypothetical protein